MRIVLLDESRERSTQLTDLLKKAKHDVEWIRSTNEFMVRLEKTAPDRILIDGDAWRHGRAIYNYFGMGHKLENIPLTVYSASEGFAGLADRPKHSGDAVVPRAASIEAIVETVA